MLLDGGGLIMKEDWSALLVVNTSPWRLNVKVLGALVASTGKGENSLGSSWIQLIAIFAIHNVAISH
jgi:hypothetical protein